MHIPFPKNHEILNDKEIIGRVMIAIDWMKDNFPEELEVYERIYRGNEIVKEKQNQLVFVRRLPYMVYQTLAKYVPFKEQRVHIYYNSQRRKIVTTINCYNKKGIIKILKFLGISAPSDYYVIVNKKDTFKG